MQLLNDVLSILLRSVVSIIVLFFLTKMMGAKQISQLTFFDYAIGISIGSIAAELASENSAPYLDTILSMIIYAVIAMGISILSNKSVSLRKFFTGEPLILISNGKPIYKNFKKAKFDINDMLSEARANGYFNMGDITYAIMETNGKISFLPKSDTRPLQPSDIQLEPEKESLSYSLISDGMLWAGNLTKIGRDENWLKKQLKDQGFSKYEDVFLAVSDGEKISILPKN